MAKVFKRIFDVILILIIIALCLYFALRSLNKILIYKVETGSMEDNIHAGDYILIVKKTEYHINDVVTFKRGNGFITHRIIKKDGSIITTKGDANNVEDDNIDEKDIVGKAIITGGILNQIISYKYILVGLLLSLYLFSCYFASGDEKEDELDEKSKIESKEAVEKDSEKTTLENDLSDESSFKKNDDSLGQFENISNISSKKNKKTTKNKD